MESWNGQYHYNTTRNTGTGNEQLSQATSYNINCMVIKFTSGQ